MRRKQSAHIHHRASHNRDHNIKASVGFGCNLSSTQYGPQREAAVDALLQCEQVDGSDRSVTWVSIALGSARQPTDRIRRSLITAQPYVRRPSCPTRDVEGGF